MVEKIKILKGGVKSNGKGYAIVVSEFNEFITKRLLDGCLDELKKNSVKPSQITVAWVPGSFEIPVVAQKFAKEKSIHAVICLGAVIRGETLHFELVAYTAALGIQQAALNTSKPVVFGVLATETIQQADARSKESGDNKGRDAARTAIKMTSLIKDI
jgi:6,7-dimethyl-8-ribityllumazine synthase